MSTHAELGTVLKNCWGDGLDPECMEIGKFCRWCHSRKPRHNEGCPIPALSTALERLDETKQWFRDDEAYDLRGEAPPQSHFNRRAALAQEKP
jgi:hypothetical protein